uniref:ST3 beta-galactoside alpha-2,3-sialyltransferase 4 n=1 Tax=Calidris pygmaea TaxID=425635 RepID=A0A8C3KIN4_9CHAR
MTSLDLLATLFPTQPRIPLAFLATRAPCLLVVILLSTRTPRSFSCLVPGLNPTAVVPEPPLPGGGGRGAGIVLFFFFLTFSPTAFISPCKKTRRCVPSGRWRGKRRSSSGSEYRGWEQGKGGTWGARNRPPTPVSPLRPGLTGPLLLGSYTRDHPLFLQLKDYFWEKTPSLYELPYGTKGSEDVLLRLLSITHYSLPESIQSLKCRRCAVVGNGHRLRNSSMGETINTYDVVIRYGLESAPLIPPRRHLQVGLTHLMSPCPSPRLNNAPVHGYEQDVGSKTTMRLFYPESAHFNPRTENNPDTLLVLVPFKPMDFQWMEAILNDKKRVRKGFWKQPPLIWDANPEQVRILNPYYMEVTAAKLLNLPMKQPRKVKQVRGGVGWHPGPPGHHRAAYRKPTALFMSSLPEAHHGVVGHHLGTTLLRPGAHCRLWLPRFSQQETDHSLLRADHTQVHGGKRLSRLLPLFVHVPPSFSPGMVHGRSGKQRPAPFRDSERCGRFSPWLPFAPHRGC